MKKLIVMVAFLLSTSMTVQAINLVEALARDFAVIFAAQAQQAAKTHLVNEVLSAGTPFECATKKNYLEVLTYFKSVEYVFPKGFPADPVFEFTAYDVVEQLLTKSETDALAAIKLLPYLKYSIQSKPSQSACIQPTAAAPGLQSIANDIG